MKIQDAVLEIYKVRTKMSDLRKEEETFKTKINEYLDERSESTVRVGDLLASRVAKSKISFNKEKAESILTPEILKKIMMSKPYTELKVEKIEVG